ncbi:MAG: hypothetical protein HPY65_07635 [Syntrophaceae bacterium]|nr:hypothetical protein [Syntrophaceae bacterium]
MHSDRSVTNVPFDQIQVGAAEEWTVVLNRTQVDLMTLVSGDNESRLR